MSPVNLFPFKKIITAFSLLLLSCAVYAQPTYCAAGLGGAAYDAPIDSVAIVGTTLQNGTPGNPYTYSAFPITGSTTTHLQQGGTYTIAVNSNSGYFANIAMWIDFNQNGSFDVFEWFSVGTNIMGTTTATFTVPLTAHTGVTGFRVRTRDNGEGSVFAYDACTNYYSGETEDYYITIDTTLPCAGTPAVGSITGPTNICPGNPFTLSLAGYTLATGLTYQWKSSPAGAGTFSPIAGATNETYTVSSLGASTDYELVITCTASGLSSTSAIWDVVSNPPTMCYCDDSTLLGGSSYYVQLDSVAIAGTTLNNYTPSNPHIYSSFPASGSTTTHLQQGATYTMAVNSGMFEPAYVGLWIDYDHTGTFDPTEFALAGASAIGLEVITFTVPLTAHTGQTGLRVRNNDYSVMPTDACANMFDGETEDYIVTIDTTYPCSGTPVAGTISGPDSVCASSVFALNASGYTVATGLTYQWFSSPAGMGTFTPIAGATNTSYMVAGQAAATDYEFQVTCTGSSGTATTPAFTIGELPFSRCYCDSASLGGTPYYATIDSVAILGTTLSNSTPFNPNTYSAYPASGSTTATLQQDGYYAIAVKSSTSGDLANRSLWIDYDHSGTFDPVEWTSVGSAMGTTLAVFHVPVTAMTGITGLRVRTVDPTDDFMGSGDACTHFFSGETEDYYITIDTAYPCSGTPVAGTISGSADICPSYAFGLSLSGYTVAAGITIQWQSSPSGAGGFTNIAGATTPLYSSAGITTATDYRAVVTCAGSGLSATSPVFSVAVNSFLNCYCSPNTGTTLVMYNGESEMTQALISGTTFNASGFSVPLSGYVQMAPLGSHTATLRIGDTYSFLVRMDSFTYYPYSAGVWIDYNQNGVFDPSEFTAFAQVPSGYGGTFTGSVTIPASCLTGQTGMRIISTDDYINYSVPCSAIQYGEVADFVITIDSSATYVPTTTTTDFSVNAFPNPAAKMVTVNAHGTPGDNPAVTLTDVTGRVITKAVMTNNTTNIDMGGLAAGVYLLKYEDGKYVRVIRMTKE